MMPRCFNGWGCSGSSRGLAHHACHPKRGQESKGRQITGNVLKKDEWWFAMIYTLLKKLLAQPSTAHMSWCELVCIFIYMDIMDSLLRYLSRLLPSIDFHWFVVFDPVPIAETLSEAMTAFLVRNAKHPWGGLLWKGFAAMMPRRTRQHCNKQWRKSS